MLGVLASKQEEVSEVEYQLASTKGKVAEYHDRVETMTQARDSLEELLQALKLYALGGIAAVKNGYADPNALLPRRLREALDEHERETLEAIHA